MEIVFKTESGAKCSCGKEWPVSNGMRTECLDHILDHRDHYIQGELTYKFAYGTPPTNKSKVKVRVISSSAPRKKDTAHAKRKN